MRINELIKAVRDGKFDAAIGKLYGEDKIEPQRARLAEAASEFEKLYGDMNDVSLFSVPGRSEISGNHTDHNHGRVIAASIDLDIIAVAAKTEGMTIRVKSKGFDEDKVDVGAPDPKNCPKYGSAAIIAGMCDGLKKRGFSYGGFCAYTTSDVLKGSGLSSSAAFEVMIGNILNYFYNGARIDAPTIAKTAQYAENVFFGKPCGLMDQTACAVGGFVAIDFCDPTAPVIEKLDFDLSAAGYSLCIVNTGGNHADLNEDYASVPAEMKEVAGELGQKELRGLTFGDIVEKIPVLRKKFGDRAILRAIHFVEENDRVEAQTKALKAGELDAFLDGVLASGRSSYMKLQNVYTTKNVSEQGLSLALAISEAELRNTVRKSAWRVHGGGFAGTIQAFVPNENVDGYRAVMESVFGDGSCVTLRVRPVGATKLEI